MSYKELMIGCGRKREKDLRLPTAAEINRGVNQFERHGLEFQGLVTLDINPDHKPDLICDLNYTPFCHPDWLDLDQSDRPAMFMDDFFDEIHAYEVLEHIGQQGDYKKFFAQFTEFHRILKPGGLFFATCPSWCSPWAWGDPSHTRVITSGTLVFLSQAEYRKQVGVTPMSDFRFCYKADFETVWQMEDQNALLFVLRAVK